MHTDSYGDPLPPLARARLGTVRFRQGRPVVHVRFSPDGQTILSIGSDGTARVWEAATGKERWYFHVPEPLHLEWLLTPDNRTLITWTRGHSIRLWDTTAGRLIRELIDASRTLRFLCLSPDGKTLAAAATDDDTGVAVVRLWDLASGEKVRDLAPPPPEEDERPFHPVSLHWTATGQVLFAEGFHSRRWAHYAWRVGTGQVLPVLAKFPRPQSWLRIAPAGNVGLVTEAVGNPPRATRLILVDVPTGETLHELAPSLPGRDSDIADLVFSPDGRTLGVVDCVSRLRLWDVASSRPVLKALTEVDVRRLIFAPSGRLLAIGTYKGRLFLCDAVEGKVLHELEGYSLTPRPERDSFPGSSIAFSSDGRLLAATGHEDLVRLWTTADGKEVRPVQAGHEGVVRALAVSPDGRLVASADGHGSVRLWDASEAREIRVLRSASGTGRSIDGRAFVAFSPDGKLIAGSSAKGAVDVWEVGNGKHRLHFQAGGHLAVSLAFTPDGQTVVTGGEGRVDRWSVATGQRRAPLAVPKNPDPDSAIVAVKGSEVFLAVSPDGRALAVAGREPRTIRFWELASGKLRQHIPKADAPMFEQWRVSNPLRVPNSVPPGGPFVVFSPDGNTVAWNQAFGIQLWDVKRARELRLFGGQDGEVTGVAFVPRHGVLAAASDAGTVRFWDAGTGTILGDLRAARGGFYSLAFSPDGKTLFTGGSDTTLLLWDVSALIGPGRRPALLNGTGSPGA